MTRRSTVLSVIAVLLVIFLNCGQYESNNPTGVTGGSESGYGEPLIRPLTPAIHGCWRWEHEIYDESEVYNFHADWTFETCYRWTYDDQCRSGTFSISGDTLYLQWSGGSFRTFTYSLENQTLTLASSYYGVKIFDKINCSQYDE